MGLVSLCASKGTFEGSTLLVDSSSLSSEVSFYFKRIRLKFLNFSSEMIGLSHNGKDLLIASPLTYPFFL